MNGAQLHLITVHLPVVGTLAAVALLLLAIARNSESLVRVALGFLVFGALCAAAAYFSGPYAHEVTQDHASLDEHLVEQHALVARAAFFALVILGAISIKIWWDSTRISETKKGARLGLLAATLAIAWLMAWTAHLGGVIRHPEIREPAWVLFPELPR